MQFLYFEDYLINPVVSFFLKILVFLSCLQLVHVFSAIEKVNKIASLNLFLCLINTKLMQECFIQVKLLVNVIDLANIGSLKRLNLIKLIRKVPELF